MPKRSRFRQSRNRISSSEDEGDVEEVAPPPKRSRRSSPREGAASSAAASSPRRGRSGGLPGPPPAPSPAQNPAIPPDLLEEEPEEAVPVTVDDVAGLVSSSCIPDAGLGSMTSRRAKKFWGKLYCAMAEARRTLDPAGTAAANEIQHLAPCLVKPLSRATVHQMLADAMLQVADLGHFREFYFHIFLFVSSIIIFLRTVTSNFLALYQLFI
jgi:hypothetical protein